ncbi:transcription termination/antitermination protein NusG [Candidatus Methylacidithermus pantelleriae]|nr:transcription termination/antitermination protein NusG [Candidatus Methylacidithermus pantelleriae]
MIEVNDKERASVAQQSPQETRLGTASTTAEQQWYSLHVLSGQEAKVKKSIEQRAKIEEMGDLIGQVVIPVERVSEIRRGKKVEAERKLFPGYVFVQMKLRDEKNKIIEKTWYFIRETPGVIGFADGDNPLPMPPDQVEALLRQVREGEEKVIPKVAFAVGDRVRVGDGPFLNSEGVIEEIDPEKGKLRVSVSIFGRSTPVDLEYWQVEKIT